VGGFIQYGFIGLFVGPVILNLSLTAWRKGFQSA
jgi:predicted PurR-regulated permease PerM